MKQTAFAIILILITSTLLAQQSVISGEVKGPDSELLPGVNIVEKDTQNGTITDQAGRFTLSLTTPDPILVISFIGYITREIEVGESSEVKVVLDENLVDLEEVVVVGYGTAKKSDLTGSVTSVKRQLPSFR